MDKNNALSQAKIDMAKIGTPKIAAPQVPQVMDTGQKQQAGAWGSPPMGEHQAFITHEKMLNNPNLSSHYGEMGQMEQPSEPLKMAPRPPMGALAPETSPQSQTQFPSIQPRVVNGIEYMPDVKWVAPPTETMPTYQGTTNYETTGGDDGKAWFWYNGSWHINTHYSPASAGQGQGQNPSLTTQQNPLMTAGPAGTMLSQPNTLNIQSSTQGAAPAANTGYWGAPGKKTMWGA